MATILKGAPVAAALTEQLIIRTEALKARGVQPKLAIVRVGARPDDIAYETGALKRMAKVGIAVQQVLLPEDVAAEALLEAIRRLNDDDSVHGVLMFRPLPRKEDEQAVINLLKPEKDMDGMTTGSSAGIYEGSGKGYPPCTAEACLRLLDHYGYDLKGMDATVIGASLVIGRPVSMMLLNRRATVTICRTTTQDPAACARRSRLLIAAAGSAGLITKEYAAPGQVVLDVGINTDADGNLCGDVRFDEVEPLVEAITPVPGGVGTVTTSVLACHVIEAAEKANE